MKKAPDRLLVPVLGGFLVAAATFAASLGTSAPAAAAEPPATATARAGGKLVVEVTGLHSDKGHVLLRLYNSQAGFPTDGGKAFRLARATISGGKAVIELRDIPFGTYAIGCVHDENGNGKLDTSWIGAPKEGIGASNDARGHRGPPQWKDARFDFKVDGAATRLRISY
jgi:uncharacterized protein (DUF2141 family)